MKNISEEQTNNKGISLVVLVITIIVALTLIATAVITTTNSIDNANITTFVKDLREIKEVTESYYITNKIMPYTNDSTVMNKDELTAIARVQNLFTEELTENNDLDAQFYIIDLAKINVTKTAYGNKQLGENDIFVIAYPSMNVYYPYGLDAKGTTYFSITSKMSNVVKINSSESDNSKVSVMISEGIKVTKINGLTNEMGINIEVDMDGDEALYMSVSGDPNKLITTTVGKNTFGFNLLSSIVNDLETIKVPTLTLAEADYIEAGTKPLADRYVDIIKYKGTEIIGKVRIDLSNFSKTISTITSATLSSYSTMNTVRLALATTEGEIKEVRYKYLTKYTEEGTIDNYYTGVTDFDPVYMKEKGRKAKLASDFTTTINAPKDVQSIKIAIIDKAGNVINMYSQDIAPKLYIGYSVDSATRDLVKLTANVFSENGIKSVTFSKSVDGINFSDDERFSVYNTTNGVTSVQSPEYLNFAINNIYIKVVAENYDSTIIENRIIKVSLSTSHINKALKINTIADQNSTINGEAPSHSNPIIPKGFKAINSESIWPVDWERGLVIEDVNQNQFVWIPVDGINITYSKWCVEGTSYLVTVNDNLPLGITSEIDQINKYGGFYIARFEAGKEGINTLVSKKSTLVWNNLNYSNAKSLAEGMYITSEVKSGLITGLQWDTVMKLIQNSGTSIINSRNFGNYSNSISPANVTGYGKLQVTGYSEYWKVNNIYDLAGNACEWSNEIYNNRYIIRGGSYNTKGDKYPVSYRDYDNSTYKNAKLGFRCALYIN